MTDQDTGCQPAVETCPVEVIYVGPTGPVDTIKGVVATEEPAPPSDTALDPTKLSDTTLGPTRDDESNRNFDSSTVTFVEQASFQNKELTSQTTYTNIHEPAAQQGEESVNPMSPMMPVPDHCAVAVNLVPTTGAALGDVDANQMSGVEAGERTEIGGRTGTTWSDGQVERPDPSAVAAGQTDDNLGHEERRNVDKRQVEFVQHFVREESTDSTDPVKDGSIKDEESVKFLGDTKVIFVSDTEDVRSSKPFETEDDSGLLENSSVGPSLDLEARPSMTDVRCTVVEQQTTEIFYQIGTDKEIPIDASIESLKNSGQEQSNKKFSNVVESQETKSMLEKNNAQNEPNCLENSTSRILDEQHLSDTLSSDKKDTEDTAMTAVVSLPSVETPRVVNVHAKPINDNNSNSVQRTSVATLNPNAPVYTPINSYSIDHQTDSRLEIVYETAFSAIAKKELDPNIPITLPVIDNGCCPNPATQKFKETFCKGEDNGTKTYMDSHVRIVVGTPCSFNAVDKYLALNGNKTDKNDSKGVVSSVDAKESTNDTPGLNAESITLLTTKHPESENDASSLDFRTDATDPVVPNKSKSSIKINVRPSSPESDADSGSSRNDELPRKYRPPTPGVQRTEREFRPANLRPPTPAPLTVYEEAVVPDESESSQVIFDAASPCERVDTTEDSESILTVLEPKPVVETNRSRTPVDVAVEPEIDSVEFDNASDIDEASNLPEFSETSQHDKFEVAEDRAPLPPPRRHSVDKKNKKSFNLFRKIFGFKSK